jgi:shikimate dehydrogenase
MTGEAKLAAVIGWPVAQSVSPQLHSFWLKEHGIKGTYVALPVAPAHFGQCIAALPLMGFAGVNVTVPHKESAFALASSLDDDARATGAVNTLVFDGQTIAGLNTDVRGFESSFSEALGKDAARGCAVAVLGAGGAARAVILALMRLGSAEVRVINRTPARSDALVRSMTGYRPIKAMKWGDWKATLAHVGLLVNTTSLGMTGKPAMEIELAALPREAAVADIVYNPLETELLRAAKARGHRTMDGLGMLMHQAVPAFAAWFGITPKVTPQLRAELERAVGG